MPMRRILAWLAVGTWLLTTGCSTYTSQMGELRPQLAGGDYQAALEALDKHDDGKDVLLTWLERGTVLHYADRWAESNEAFEAAERTADDLYTKSISEGALSLLTNDTNISYRARPYELAMIPYFRALNYVDLGQRTDAVVEGRKASLLMAKYVDATLDELDDEKRDDFASTKNDAFLLHLSGMLYEWDDEVNDAFIAYRNAAAAYQDNAARLGLQIPPSLAGDLVRTARWLGFGSELAEARRNYPAVFAAAGDTARDGGSPDAVATGDWPSGTGQVVLFVETGFVSAKEQVRADVPILESEKDDDVNSLAMVVTSRYGAHYVVPRRAKIAYWLSFAVPTLPPNPPRVGGVRVTADTGWHARGYRTQDLDALARLTFDAESGKILLKTAARALTKYLTTRQAEKAGKVAGVLANLFGAATETADTREWLTLPHAIYLVRMVLPAGEHTLHLALTDGSDRALGTIDVGPVAVRAGDWTFLSQRHFPAKSSVVP